MRVRLRFRVAALVLGGVLLGGGASAGLAYAAWGSQGEPPVGPASLRATTVPVGDEGGANAPGTGAGDASGAGAADVGGVYQETRLLFGTARPGGGDAVTEEEFRAFVTEFVTPRFPEGLSVQEGYGQYLDAHGVIERERSYELVLYFPAGEDRDAAIEEVRREYCERFGQESVGRVDDRVRMDF
ncbi:DUF3574 domain-containing protein [Streptomyces hoynatensis]|uniref:DUF3574 domain-containing protein n=1 Tax=Streptomyces hoynatensis TaxID=1141874 RepID=A0A3A9YP44_9ACTN|nr:DUF3574 domain-containing protein [Streptomyces hoynatensis]RKN36877.1 DUF3574 domain-containing protein [Streptomyces hoynatensis]